MFQSSRSSCSTRLLSLLLSPAASPRSRNDSDASALIAPTFFLLRRMIVVPLHPLQADRSEHLLHHVLPRIPDAMLQVTVREFDQLSFVRSFSVPFFQSLVDT